MSEQTPAIDPSIAYLADAIERSAILQSAHMRLLLRQLQGYHFDIADKRVLQAAIDDTIAGRNMILKG